MLTPAEAQSDAGMTHGQMHEMMDAMYGEGAMPVMMGEPDRAFMSDTMRRMMGR